MLESPDTILGGLRILQKILGVKTCYIGIEENKPDAIELLRQKTAGQGDLAIVSLHVKYPQGAEKQLIKAITGREVPPGGLPMDVGAVVQNVGTAHAIFEAVTRGIPLIDGALYGIKAAVLVIVVEALIRIGKRALKSPLLLACAGAALGAVMRRSR